MAKRRRIIEGTWTCDSCGSKGIRGRHKICPSCGSPREKAEASFSFDATQSTTDAGALELAAAGRDWQCAACDASNRGDAQDCRQCGTPRGQAAPPDPINLAVPVAAAGLGAGALGIGGVVLLVLCASLLWMVRPIEVEATVAERTFTRQVDVERLVSSEHTGWKDALPALASPPGSSQLAAGLGDIHRCETQTCYPRPPDGGRLVVVTGRRWSRTHTVQPMVEHSGSGWDEAVPPATGAWPSGGTGGSEGRHGAPSCRSKERTPERCRTESHQEACGTEERCTVRDLGNGFAEEVCEDITKYCSVDEEVCDPAVRDDWCTWTELRWGSGRSQTRSGTLEKPRWPALAPGRRDRLLTRQTNLIEVDTLAGSGEGPVSVSGSTLTSHAPGQQYFVGSGAPERVPESLVRRGSGPFRDCGAGIPHQKLVDRDECRYDVWAWQPDPPVQASASTLPEWPAVDLRDDGRQERSEWATVEMRWSRGKKTGSETVQTSVKEAQRWSPGASVPIKVTYSGELDERLGDWPRAEAAR